MARLQTVVHLFAEGLIYAPDKEWADRTNAAERSYSACAALCFPGKRIDDAPGKLVPVLQNFLNVAIFSSGGACTVLSRIVSVAWSSAVVTDLQTKVQKYETKAAQCEEQVRQAADGPQRAFYEVLAHYYGKLATDVRQIIAKRQAT